MSSDHFTDPIKKFIQKDLSVKKGEILSQLSYIKRNNPDESVKLLKDGAVALAQTFKTV